MRILFIWKNDYPWDVRVDKICTTLVDASHEVHLICSNIKKQKTKENLQGLHIHRLPAFKNDLLNKICSTPIFFNPLWIYKILKIVKNEKIEAIIVRDLPLVLTGILAGRTYNIPVIFDMAENYPALWKEHVDKGGGKFYNFFLKNPRLAEIMENIALKKANHIFVVVEESEKRLLGKGIPLNKISIISNTPELSLFERKSENKNDSKGDDFRLLYVGGIESAKRGLDTMIRAIPLLTKEIENLLIMIVGDGAYLNKLRKLAADLGVEKYVCFCGRTDYSTTISYIYSCDICVVPHYVTEHVNSTIPNKLFEYMACKKPVIVSDAVPLRRIVEESNSGRVFKSSDVLSFAENVLEMRDPIVRREMGRNGYNAVVSKYNWLNDSFKLKEIFCRLAIK